MCKHVRLGKYLNDSASSCAPSGRIVFPERFKSRDLRFYILANYFESIFISFVFNLVDSKDIFKDVRFGKRSISSTID